MHLFYTPDIDITQQIETYYLNEEESKHGVRVLRLQERSEVALIDGKGNFFRCEILVAHPKRMSVRVLSVEKEVGKRNHYLHVAVAPTKHTDRLEWFLEKATEIGIDEITPLICERSERKEIKIERLNKVITAAMKQSQTAYLPKLNQATKLASFLQQENKHTQRFIAHCLNDEKSFLTQAAKPQNHYCILIGPEGDFSPEEIHAAQQQDYVPISLGNTRLRTETAALYACMEINLLNRLL